MNAPVRISVVIPAYNEASRIADPIRRIASYLAGRDETCELIVVDDGSSDGTAEVLREIAPDLPVRCRVLRYGDNRGKGHALKIGFAHATGECILLSDADLSTPIEEFDRLYERIEAGHDIAIGSRKMLGAQVTIRQPFVRERLGKVFTWLSNLLIAEVSDVTCGFKLYRGAVGRDLFGHARIDNWSFDAEILYLARIRRHRLAEVPVRWHDEPGTKVSLLRDGLVSGFDLLRIRWNGFRGHYGRPVESDARVEELALPRSPDLDAPPSSAAART